jgi:Tol biopolymer transport system component
MRVKPMGLAVIALVLGGVLEDATLRGQGAPGSVAFFTARDGNNEIYLMNPDGQEAVRVTDNPFSDVDPDLSTSGREIVFTSNRGGNNDVYVIESTGGVAVNLTQNAANDGWARWAPDGHRIVFHSNRSGNFELYAMNGDGSEVVRLTDYAGVDQFPEWSPDGQEIAFRRDTDIYVLHVRTGQIRRLTDAPPLNQMASWSPNGKELAFMSQRAGYVSVFVMNSDGSNQRNLTPKDPTDLDSDWISRAPSWSTNGRQIYFMSSRPSTGLDTEIFVVNSDGTGTHRITDSIGMDGSPRAR